MKFDDALAQVAVQLELDPNELIAYAAEDDLPGCCDYPGQAGRSDKLIPYTYDGKFLYALIRALKPQWILESGTLHGGSAAHMALAMDKNCGGQYKTTGRIATVDINPEADLTGVPDELQKYIAEFPGESIIDYVAYYNEFQFIHEDASHEIDTVQAVYEALPRILTPGGVIVSHDTNSLARQNIIDGIQAAGFEYPPDYVYEESPCGFSVMRYGVKSE